MEYVTYTNAGSASCTLYLKVFGKVENDSSCDSYRLSPTW